MPEYLVQQSEELFNELMNYCEQCLEGEITVCQKHKWAIERFLFISEQLQAIGIMSNLDVDCLGRYVKYQYEWEKAVKGLDVIPPFKKDGRRYIPNEEYDKMVNIVNKLQKAVKQEASGLGLSISDRCKLVIPKVDIPEKSNEDPFDAFFGGDE